MKSTDESTRRQALEWWNQLNVIDKSLLAQKYSNFLYGRGFVSLTGSEIEEIWKKETLDTIEEKANQLKDDEYLDIQTLNIVKASDLKINQKQFKEFNPELFKSYISKFSDEDKLRAFEILFNSCKKWDGINNAAPFYMSICRAYNAGKQNMIDIFNNPSPGNESINPKFVSSDGYFKQEFGFE